MTNWRKGGISKGPGRAPSETDATFEWARAAIQQGRADDAERLVRNVLAGIPQHPTALHLLGCALLLQDRPGQALAPLEKAARSRQDPEIETQLAIALRKVGRTDDALARLDRATKRRPPFPAAFHELGFLLHSLDRSEEAIAVIERGAELVPGAPELSVQLGGIHHARRDLSKARAAYSQALAIAPDHADAHYGAAVVLMDEGEFSQAAEHLRRSLAKHPADVQARLKLGVCLLELGRSDDALGCLRTAIHRRPQLYGIVLRLVSSAARGRFWLRPSSAAKALR